MAIVDPRDVYRRMIAGLGIQASQTPGEGEFGYYDGTRFLLNPLDAVGKARRYYGNGFNPNEFWYENNGQGAQRPWDVLKAQVDPYFKAYFDLKNKGLLSQDDANALADHYMRGVGVPKELWGGNRPQQLTDYIIALLQQLGANNIGNYNPVPGQPPAKQ